MVEKVYDHMLCWIRLGDEASTVYLLAYEHLQRRRCKIFVGMLLLFDME